MKLLFALSCLVSLSLAEPPRYRQQYYIARVQEETTVASAPYPASGWKPDGPSFELPQRQVDGSYGAPPKQQYGPPPAVDAPQQQYGAPAAPEQQYGAPTVVENQQQLNRFNAQQRQRGFPQKFRAPVAPQRQYSGPSAPARQQFAPSNPQQQYGAPSNPQQQYGAPSNPQQQYGAPSNPQQQYGAPSNPQQQYGAPSNPPQEYGPPEEPTTVIPLTTTESEEVSTDSPQTEAEFEPVNSVNELDKEGDADEQQQQQERSGEYYIALPDGRLQRIQYMSREDLEAMKFFAKIRAENVEPLRGPIYAYSPLQKLQVAPANLEVAVVPAAAAVTPVALQEKPKTLEIQPISAQIQYQLDNPAAPVKQVAFTGYTSNYQVPVSNPESRYILSFQ